MKIQRPNESFQSLAGRGPALSPGARSSGPLIGGRPGTNGTAPSVMPDRSIAHAANAGACAKGVSSSKFQFQVLSCEPKVSGLATRNFRPDTPDFLADHCPAHR